MEAAAPAFGQADTDDFEVAREVTLRGGSDAAAVFTDFDSSRDEDVLQAGAQAFGQIYGDRLI